MVGRCAARATSRSSDGSSAQCRSSSSTTCGARAAQSRSAPTTSENRRIRARSAPEASGASWPSTPSSCEAAAAQASSPGRWSTSSQGVNGGSPSLSQQAPVRTDRAAGRSLLGQGQRQAGLADPRIPGQQEQATLALEGGIERCATSLQEEIAAHQHGRTLPGAQVSPRVLKRFMAASIPSAQDQLDRVGSLARP